MNRPIWTLALTVAIGCGPQVVFPGEDDTGGGSSSGGRGSSGVSRGDTGQPRPRPRPPGDGDGDGDPSIATSAADGPLPDFGLPPLDDSGGVCPSWAYEGCVLPAMPSEVPALADFWGVPMVWAVFGSQSGCGGCVNDPNVADLIFFADPGLVDHIEPWSLPEQTLQIMLATEGFDGPAGEWVDGDAVLGMSSAGPAQVLLDAIPTADELADPYDPGTAVVLGGEITASVSGLAIEGTFAAAYCPSANIYFICE